MSALNLPEPAPTRNDRPASWDLVVADAERMALDAFPARDLAIADMRERDAAGRAKYGTALQAGNGRDQLIDAYQEALDLAVYLRTALVERYDGLISATYRMALCAVFMLREAIAARGR